MSLDLRLLQVLSDGDFHSGDELGLIIGVSRTAVWKKIQKLQQECGVEIQAVKGRGYCLPGGLELLDQDRVLTTLSNEAANLLRKIELKVQVDSTNALAMSQAIAGIGSGYVVVAETQSAGRGRRGRAWVSPFGANLYLSVVWGFDGGAAAIEGLSLVVGIAVARCLAELGLERVGLKWPNDIYWNDKKLGGVLLEMAGDSSGRCQVVVGIGLNINMPKAAAAEIDQPWFDLTGAAGHPISRNLICAKLLSHLLPILDTFERDKFSLYREEWASFDCIYGREVIMHLGDRVVPGVAAGVGDSGALAVDTELGREWFHGGEVSLRLV